MNIPHTYETRFFAFNQASRLCNFPDAIANVHLPVRYDSAWCYEGETTSPILAWALSVWWLEVRPSRLCWARVSSDDNLALADFSCPSSRSSLDASLVGGHASMTSGVPVVFAFSVGLCTPFHAGGGTHTACNSITHVMVTTDAMHTEVIRLFSVTDHSEYRCTKESEWEPPSFFHHTGTDKTRVLRLPRKQQRNTSKTIVRKYNVYLPKERFLQLGLALSCTVRKGRNSTT